MELEISEKRHSVMAINRAKKYVKRLRSWYWGIPMNLLVTAFFGALSYLMYQNGEPNTIIRILMSSPMGLWVIFMVEGIVLKMPKIVRSWEERALKRYMKRDTEVSKYE